jgi:putative NADH-flavin reductase
VNLAVFGATGGTGRRVVDRALRAGHAVTVLARHPDRVTSRSARLRVLQGDVLDPADVRSSLCGADAVVSALGIGRSRAPTHLYSVGTGNVLAAAQEAGVRRLTCISTSGLQTSPDTSLAHRLVAELVLQRALRNPYNDMTRMEATVAGSDLDWTIVRAARLTDGPFTGVYRVSTSGPLPRAWSISRSDLADYVVTHAADPALARTRVDIAY